ncbi:MAG: hypothetical protein KJ011_10010 [Burkholderiaceae bacterium]|nr:hypothetical protein [Burkholderiaceae bacterium]
MDLRIPHRTRTRLLIATGLSATLAFGAASPAAEPAPQRFGNDVYLHGSEVAMRTAVPGDAVVAGGRVAVTGGVGGDALVFGGAVSIESSVGQDLYAAGGEVRVAGPVGESARLAGGRVIIASDADIAGGVIVAGGQVTLDGHVRRYALIGAGHTEVNGRVDGDLRVVGGELSLGPNAVVQGRLDYRGAEPPRIAPGAQVQGGVVEAAADADGSLRSGASIVWLVGSIVAGIVLLALAPRASRRVTQALRARPVASPLLGAALFVGLPLVAVLLMITVVGIPLGLLAIVALMALFLLGYLATAAALGDSLVERRGPAKTWQRLLATALALLVLFVLGQLPYVGWAVWLLALLFGSGAIALAVLGARRSRPAPST